MIFRIKTKELDKAEELVEKFVQEMDKQLQKRSPQLPMTYFYKREKDYIDFYILSPIDSLPKFLVKLALRKSKKALEEYFKSNGIKVKIEMVWTEKK